ncbi:MAG: methionyl-tRNA formyltransferase [Candidatus Omnitrophota bacterium]|nr:methionyl-tRNA formyltransferase [Candidatus Omnitrophota bacterium]
MRMVFFGTSEFAIPVLRELIAVRHNVLALVTRPDRKSGRNLKVSPPPTKVLALAKNIPVYQPQDVSSRESAEYLAGLDADLFVVISFGQILKKEILSLPKFYSINLHGSLLPKYRGASPTNWAIINGDKLTGVTVIKMNERMDEGDIILKREIAIGPEDTNITLNEKLSGLGAEALSEAIDLIASNGNIDLEKQDDSEATYAPKLKKEDGLINWNEPAIAIHNKVRGLIPWPGAYTHYEGKILKILNTGVPDTPFCGKGIKTGEVVDIIKNEGILTHTGSGNILIKHLQLEGKKALDADSFVRGHRIPGGYHFGE